MTGQQWFTNKYGYTCFGPQTDGLLINTKGIQIYPKYGVVIAHFDQYGGPTRPLIKCNENKFGIYE